MRLGVHCPVGGGFEAALKRALALGCESMQMLPYRRHHEGAAEDFSGFAKARREIGIRALLIHSRFVPSLASSDAARRRRSIELLTFELGLAARWGADGYVLHAGAYSAGGSAGEGLRLVGESIAEAVERENSRAPLFLENVPGGGRRLGGTLEELAELIESLRRRGLAAFACLDTAHAWAAGYDVASAEGMLAFLARAHRLLGAENVRAFHLNDTEAPLDSHREHHACWGQGRLGEEGIRVLLSRPEHRDAAGVLEVPPGVCEEDSLARLRRLS